MANNRIEFIDLAKGVCILQVVALHLIPSIESDLAFMGFLRMPLYFCLSGLFYKSYGRVRNFLTKKTNKILIPFIAWYIIAYGLYFLGRMAMSSESESLYHWSDIFTTNQLYNLPIWFLLCLFWSNVLFSIINYITNKWIYQAIGVVIMATIGIGMSYFEIFNLFYIGSALTSMPFFFLGYSLKQSSLLYPTKNKKRDFWLMVISLGCAIALIFIPEIQPKYTYYKNEFISGNPLYIYICSIFFVIGVLLGCKFIDHLPGVSRLGRYSIIVLVTHVFFGAYVGTLLDIVTGGKIMGTLRDIIIFGLVLGSMSFIIPFCKKYLGYITAQKDIINLPQKDKSEIKTEVVG